MPKCAIKRQAIVCWWRTQHCSHCMADWLSLLELVSSRPCCLTRCRLIFAGKQLNSNPNDKVVEVRQLSEQTNTSGEVERSSSSSEQRQGPEECGDE